MLRVSRRSWHMRWMQFLEADNGIYQPRDLCSHFWGVVFSLVFFGALGAGAVTAVIVGVFLLITKIIVPYWPVIATLAAFIGVAFGVVWACSAIGRAWKRGRNQAVPQGTPNLLVEYLKAKKRRVCPLIEVVD